MVASHHSWLHDFHWGEVPLKLTLEAKGDLRAEVLVIGNSCVRGSHRAVDLSDQRLVRDVADHSIKREPTGEAVFGVDVEREVFRVVGVGAGRNSVARDGGETLTATIVPGEFNG